MSMAHRRTTLGTLSSSGINARAGAGGPPRLSTGPAKRSSLAVPTSRAGLMSMRNRGGSGMGSGGGGRISNGVGSRSSLAASSVGGRKSSAGIRRSSAYGAGGGRSDPRPISDKGFIAQSIRTLVEYLSDHGYDQPISGKILTRPSGRDFTNIMGFLFRQYDSTWQPSSGRRFEEEVIPFLKAVRYPFTLSKASLQAVGAPQTWPKVLAAISWLVELLHYDEEVTAYEADHQVR